MGAGRWEKKVGAKIESGFESHGEQSDFLQLGGAPLKGGSAGGLGHVLSHTV